MYLVSDLLRTREVWSLRQRVVFNHIDRRPTSGVSLLFNKVFS